MEDAKLDITQTHGQGRRLGRGRRAYRGHERQVGVNGSAAEQQRMAGLLPAAAGGAPPTGPLLVSLIDLPLAGTAWEIEPRWACCGAADGVVAHKFNRPGSYLIDLARPTAIFVCCSASVAGDGPGAHVANFPGPSAASQRRPLSSCR